MRRVWKQASRQWPARFFLAADAPILGANPPAFKRSGKPVSKSLLEVSAGRGPIAFILADFGKKPSALRKNRFPKAPFA